MAITRVVDDLNDVRFYTALDPYYYVTDNRPLNDLDYNIRLVAEASDAATGGADRAALGAAAVAYSQVGYGIDVGGDPYRNGNGMYVGGFEISGADLIMGHGFLVTPEDRGGTPAYVEPVISVHDAATAIQPQTGRGGMLQVTHRTSTDTDRIGSSASTIQVAEITWKQGTTPGDFPLPDAGAICLMQIDVPSGATTIEPEYITLVNMRTNDQTADQTRSVKVNYNTLGVTLTTGVNVIALAGTDIELDRVDSCEVYVEGVNQFDWTFDAPNSRIVLASAVTADSEVRVRQAKLSYA